MFIIFVKDQYKSRTFYQNVLSIDPVLDAEGMTEFKISDNVIFGIMPEEGIVRILDNKIPHPSIANGIPRNELYLTVDDPEAYISRLVANGGKLISELKLRNWGDHVAYGMDPDGNILAFARK